MQNFPHSPQSNPVQVLLAEWVIGAGPVVIQGGGVALSKGRIARVFDNHAAARRWARESSAQVHSLPSGILAPGWVNAHCHLELTELAGKIPVDQGFSGWIGHLTRAKRELDLVDYRQGVELGAKRMLEGGTTSVGDIDSQNVGGALDSPIRMRLYREALDAFHQHRSHKALASVAEPLELRPGLQEGLAPHASFTVSPGLMEGMAKLARKRSLPVTVHWSETQEEVDWLLHGTGPFGDLLGDSPRRSGLDVLEGAGLLAPHLSLAHGNWPAPGEEERLARAGVSVVHCPGSHLFFGRGPFPLQRYLEAGVCLALGTDSQASNECLDMGREVALLRDSFPQVDAGQAFRMATEHGARALGWSDDVGRIEVGLLADLVHFEAEIQRSVDVLQVLTRENLPAGRTWVGGSHVF
ncbi:MAG: amidohydrolase family protein [bacterium]|nr:amidohydrolase family protein [bacterium]